MSYSDSTKKKVQNMGCYLKQFDWTFFATFTTTYPINPKQGRRFMENYHSYLVKLGYKTTIFWVTEPFYNKESGYHIHALIKIDVVEDLQTLIKALKGAWRRISRGSSISSKTTLIDPYNKEKQGNYYVAKYICAKNTEYDVFV